MRALNWSGFSFYGAGVAAESAGQRGWHLRLFHPIIEQLLLVVSAQIASPARLAVVVDGGLPGLGIARLGECARPGWAPLATTKERGMVGTHLVYGLFIPA